MSLSVEKEEQKMAIGLKNGQIVFIFEDFEYTVPDEIALDIAHTIAQFLRHKSSRKRQKV
jgi:hypothetical protein